MARYALAIDCNRCVGCMACNGACKMTNNVPIGSFWNKVLRIGPTSRAKARCPATTFTSCRCSASTARSRNA